MICVDILRSKCLLSALALSLLTVQPILSFRFRTVQPRFSLKSGFTALSKRAPLCPAGNCATRIRVLTDDPSQSQFLSLSPVAGLTPGKVLGSAEDETGALSALNSAKMLKELECKPVNFAKMKLFWTNLYDNSDIAAVHAAGLLKTGPLLYRMNVLDADKPNLCIHSCYDEYYKTLMEAESRLFSFVTGTPGIGKSCFRTYMMWRQMQDMKANNASGAIIATKAPQGKSSDQVLVMDKGRIAHILETKTGDLCHWLRTTRIPVYVHVDCSNGDSESSEGTRNFYYTSPYEKAWREKNKERGDLVHLPLWSEQDLWRYYLTMGVNGKFLKRLAFNTEQDIAMSKAIAENARGKLLLLPDNETVRVEVAVPGQPNALWCAEVPKTSIEQVIEDEMDRVGPIPRNMFAVGEDLIQYETRVECAMQSAQKDFSQDGLTMYLNDEVRQILLQYNPLKGDIRRAGPSSWAGSYSSDKVLTEVFRRLNRLLTKSAITSAAGNDPKVSKSAALAVLRLMPSSWNLRRVGTNSSFGPAMVSSMISFNRMDIENSHKKDFDVEVATNLELENHMKDLSWTDIVRPFSKFYSAIDGVARFRIGNVLYTAFLQVASSTTREVNAQEEGAMKRLNALTETALESSAIPLTHKAIWLWMITGPKESTRSLDKQLLTRLTFLSEEYVAIFDANAKPDSDLVRNRKAIDSDGDNEAFSR